MDALVAEKVFGLKVWTHDGPCGCRMAGPDYLKPYSTDVVSALEVIEKLRPRFNWELILGEGRTVGLKTYGTNAPSRLVAYAGDGTESDAHAICLAALKAVGA